MTSLRARIVALMALVALLSTAACALAAARAVRIGLAQLEGARVDEAIATVRARFEEMMATMAFEARGYARSDELYARMPLPPRDWARGNLAVEHRGGVTRVIALAAGGEIVGRYRADDVRDHRASAEDPAHPRALAALVADAEPASGLATLGGSPAVWASHPVVPGDGDGAARGTLLALTYVDEALCHRVAPHGWRVEVTTADHPAPATIERAGDELRAVLALPARDGALVVRLVGDRRGAQLLALESQVAITAAGLVTAALAVVAGSLLGWRWLKPVHELAEACRARALDPSHPLPRAAGLAEADVLVASLSRLIDAERAARDDVSHALVRETTANAVHQRFLAQLGHELGDPIRTLIEAATRLDEQGRIEPERAAGARAAAAALEERLQEVLGLASGFSSSSAPLPSHARADEFLAGIAGLLEVQARRRGVRLAVDAPSEPVPIDRRLLAPILVNLASNALRASTGGTVTLSARREGDEGIWTVLDEGPGIPRELAERITAACRRGEVLPGEPGIGLGLALALANARALGGGLRLVANGPGGVAMEVRAPLKTGTGHWRRRTA